MGLGILFVVGGIVGGGVTLAGQEIPRLSSVLREIILGVFGVVLMVASLYLRPAQPSDKESHGEVRKPPCHRWTQEGERARYPASVG